LGLHLSNLLIQKMKGKIIIESIVGKGTKVTIIFQFKSV